MKTLSPRSTFGRSFARFLLLAIALPCVYLGGASAAFFYRQHSTNVRLLHLPASLPARQQDRVFVFAPHPDDEALGCAGLIQQTLAAGGQARVGVLTNGDGYRTAVECTLHTLRVGPKDYIRYADLRQQESIAAMSRLGLKAEAVLFFGYPDAGLTPLFNDYWTPDVPYCSFSTRCETSPYARTFRPGTAYCGFNVCEDIKNALRQFRPTLVTVTHPGEDHADHAAAAAFVACALRELQNDPKEKTWAAHTRLQYYLVHRGDWPLPQGARFDEPLLPPLPLSRADTRWHTLPLTPTQTQIKLHSIDAYVSQNAMMRRFLIAFARRTELLGDLPDAVLPRVAEGTMRADADPHDWHTVPPLLLDPVGDNIQRDLQGDGDIRACYACRDSHTLYLRVDCRQNVSRRFVYVVRLRAFGQNGTTPRASLALRLRPSDAPSPANHFARLAANGHILEAALPWDTLTTDKNDNMVTLAFQASTLLAGVQEVDRTGVRLLRVTP